MADVKWPAAEPPDEEMPRTESRRSRIVHDHKGTAHLEWQDAPPDYVPDALELQNAARSSDASTRALRADHLSIAGSTASESHDPYTRSATAARRLPGKPRDLRKLSAWIKMMRQLEEGRRTRPEDAQE